MNNGDPSLHPARHALKLIHGFRNYLHFTESLGVTGLDCSEENVRRVRAWGTWPVPETESLERIQRDLGDCRRCGLAEQRRSIVFGSGNPNARLMFVGDGPGPVEDESGQPFADESGRLLTNIIHAIGLTRNEVYLCYIVKCLRPGSRSHLPSEITACLPFVQRQIRSIRPECICALGAVAAQSLLAATDPITKLRGHFHDYEGIHLMPTFHPDYVLKNTAHKREVWEDMKQIEKLLRMRMPTPDK